jgi:fructose 1,6-bisphosphate aldolase/phosphatase
MPVTLSVIKADVGGYVGHSSTHPALMEKAQEMLNEAKSRGLLVDFHVTHVGDDLELIMTHGEGEGSEEVHKLAWNVFMAATEVARTLKLYGAGQDLLSDSFAGTMRGMGPGVAEMVIEERPSEPVIIFMADKTSAGAWNLPLYKIFADPFNSAGLVIAESMHQGFTFEIADVRESRKAFLNAPEEIYDLLMFLGAPSRYAVKRVISRSTGTVGAVASTERLSQIAGRYVGKDDPVLIVRCQGRFPAVGEVLEPFARAFLVEGWMRGSHHGPMMPCALEDANPSRFDGPPRVVALGFQLAEGKLVGPRDMFADPAFDEARHEANVIANYMRSHGPFEPHRLSLEEMEYTTMPDIMQRLEKRWVDM